MAVGALNAAFAEVEVALLLETGVTFLICVILVAGFVADMALPLLLALIVLRVDFDRS